MKTTYVAAIVVVIIVIAAVGYYATTLGGPTSTTTTSSSSIRTTLPTTTTSSTVPITTSSSSSSRPSSSSSSSSTTTTSVAALGPNITIAMSVSQVGAFASLDSGYLYLNQAWQAGVNSGGGLVDKNGQRHLVRVISQDDHSDPPTAISLYHQFAEQQKVNLMVSPYSADIGIQLLPIAEQDHTPIIMSEASTAQMWNGTYHWAVSPLVPYWSNNVQQAWSGSYFRMLNQSQWAHTIGFVGWDITWAIDDYSSGLWLANHTQGMRVVYKQLLAPNFANPDFTQQINALKALNPDIVYLAMFGPFCAIFINQANSAGFHPKEWHTIEWGASFAAQLQKAGVSTEGITSEVFWSPSYPKTFAGTSDFLATMANADKLARAAGATPVTWYNYQNIEIRWYIFQMIQAAVAQIPSSDFANPATLNTDLNNAIHHLDIQTISGQLTIAPQGYGTIGLSAVQFQKGFIQTVFPQQVTNATYAHP